MTPEAEASEPPSLEERDQADRRAALQLADAIERNRATIETRWLERVMRDIAEGSGWEPTQLRDGLPDYLVELVNLLRHGARGEVTPLSEAAWTRVAGEHGVTRVRLGFDIAQLIHEFVVLRQVIQEVAREHGLGGEDPWLLLSDVMDAAISGSVRAYVNARDYEARKKQAEHIGFLTHELRNPLSTAVLSTAQLRQLASDDQMPSLERLERNHQRLLELLDSVLSSQKLEAGKADVRPVSLRLDELMGPILEGVRVAASKKQLVLEVAFDANEVVRCDPELTRSAIQNLLDNAVKYTDAGKVELVLEARADQLMIHVRDTCPGLSQEELRTIFEPFERGESATRRQPGTGLGLAIARRAVEAQGGSVQAESPGPLGCHFWITLPQEKSQHRS